MPGTRRPLPKLASGWPSGKGPRVRGSSGDVVCYAVSLIHMIYSLRTGVSLLVWWQFLRRSLAGGSGLEQEGASWGSGFSTKIHQEVVPRCPVTSLPCPR